MASNLLEAEATGQQFIEAAFGGTTFRVPLDVDSWPIDAIRASRAVNLKTNTLVVNHPGLTQALRLLLGDEQWSVFLKAFPRRRHLVPASHAFAAAVGFPAGEYDVVFGAIPPLLSLLDRWPDKVESDLHQFWGIDYRDRWLFQAGRRRLTLRQIQARVTNLPTTSALAVAINGGSNHKTGTELVLMDIYEKWFGQRHPSRPMSPEELAARAVVADAEAKARAKYRAKHDKNSPDSAKDRARANARRNQERDAHAQEAR